MRSCAKRSWVSKSFTSTTSYTSTSRCGYILYYTYLHNMCECKNELWIYEYFPFVNGALFLYYWRYRNKRHWSVRRSFDFWIKITYAGRLSKLLIHYFHLLARNLWRSIFHFIWGFFVFGSSLVQVVFSRIKSVYFHEIFQRFFAHARTLDTARQHLCEEWAVQTRRLRSRYACARAFWGGRGWGRLSLHVQGAT